MTSFRQITRDDILKGRDAEYPLGALEANLLDLLDAANAMAEAYFNDTGRQIKVKSGYRPGHYNRNLYQRKRKDGTLEWVHGAPQSAHLTCEAIDWWDTDGKLDAWIQAHLAQVVEFGFIGIERPSRTPGWAHTDIKQRYNPSGRLPVMF